MGKRSLKRRIASLLERIIEHDEKIARELRELHPDQGLIKHWQVEIIAFTISRERALKRLG
jgi:hypothetical protein